MWITEIGLITFIAGEIAVFFARSNPKFVASSTCSKVGSTSTGETSNTDADPDLPKAAHENEPL